MSLLRFISTSNEGRDRKDDDDPEKYYGASSRCTISDAARRV